MTALPLPPPPFDDTPDERLPDALTNWHRLQRQVFALLSYSPAQKFNPQKSGAISSELHARMLAVNHVAMTTIRPRTKVTEIAGYERAEPAAAFWCVAAALTPDDGAGARLIQSEAGDLLRRKLPQYAIAIGLATRNEAARRFGHDTGGAVFRLVTGDNRREHAGYFGRQSGRWAASIQDPSMRALEAWRLASALHGDGQDFTHGARRWDDGYTQDRLYRAGKVKHDALGIVRKWAADGWEWVGSTFEPDAVTPLIDPYRLMLFRFAGRHADVWRGEQAVRDGRSRWRM